MFDGGFGADAVAEIEDMRAALGLFLGVGDGVLSASPPAMSASGSMLPCSHDVRVETVSAANDSEVCASSEIALAPVSRA